MLARRAVREARNVDGRAAVMQIDLELARQHVSRSRRLVADQIELIQRMKRLGWETVEPERTLELFEQRLVIFEDDLRALEAVKSGQTTVDSPPG
jgi:hypothetical protein